MLLLLNFILRVCHLLLRDILDYSPGVNVIKLFSFVTDDEALPARGFVLANPFQSGLKI
jgi:hypothetical protein